MCGACPVEPPKPLQHCDAVTSRGKDAVPSVVPRNESSPIVSVCPSPATPVSPGTSTPASSCELSTGQRESADRLPSADQRNPSGQLQQPFANQSASSSGRTCTQMASGLTIESTQGAPDWTQKTPESSALSGGESGRLEGTRGPSSIRMDVSVQQPLEAVAGEEAHVGRSEEPVPGTAADDTTSHLGITVEKAGAW